MHAGPGLLRTFAFLPFLAVSAAFAANAPDLPRPRVAGVLGNSGEAGATQVRFGEKSALGMGVAHDARGALWDRGGDGVLIRYALDGRQLARFPLPASQQSNDRLALVGDTLVLLVDNRVLTLPVDAEDGQAPADTPIRATGMSLAAVQGRVALDTGEGLQFFDPETGDLSGIVPWRAGFRPTQMVFGPEDRLYVVQDHRIAPFDEETGALAAIESWPREEPGDSPQWLNNAWWGHRWHGTLRRFDAELAADPGVVLGGASGSFIGHLAQNSDVENGRGVAFLGGRRYAISGRNGVMHLMDWDNQLRTMTLTRRLGALPRLAGFALDAEGRVIAAKGNWEWSDGADAPLRNGMNTDLVGPATVLPTGAVVGPGHRWGHNQWIWGNARVELRDDRLPENATLDYPQNLVGIAAAPAPGGGYRVYLANGEAKTVCVRVNNEGTLRESPQPVEIRFAQPVTRLHDLSEGDDGFLHAAVDGAVVKLRITENGLEEIGRRDQFKSPKGVTLPAPELKFGRELHLAYSAGRLWVADTEYSRVLALDASSFTLLALHGQTGKAGDSLRDLDRPTLIRAQGRRAVVYDAGNQRLVKLTLDE